MTTLSSESLAREISTSSASSLSYRTNTGLCPSGGASPAGSCWWCACGERIMSPGVGGWPGSPGTRERWFSREPSREVGPRPRVWRVGKGGPGAGPPRRVGKVRPEVGPWEEGSTGAVGVGFRASGGKGRAMEGVRGWSRELQMVRASIQNVETWEGKEEGQAKSN